MLALSIDVSFVLILTGFECKFKKIFQRQSQDVSEEKMENCHLMCRKRNQMRMFCVCEQSGVNSNLRIWGSKNWIICPIILPISVISNPVTDSRLKSESIFQHF